MYSPYSPELTRFLIMKDVDKYLPVEKNKFDAIEFIENIISGLSYFNAMLMRKPCVDAL